MLQTPLLKLRDLRELQCSQIQRADEFITPFKVKKPRRTRTAETKPKLPIVGDEQQSATDPVVVVVPSTPKPVSKRIGKSARKEPPPSQMRINSFFKTCEKSYKIEPLKEQPATTISQKAAKTKGRRVTSTAKNSPGPRLRPRKMGRKRLFADETSESDYELASNDKQSVDSDWKPAVRESKTTTECITIISDSDEEEIVNKPLTKTDVIKNNAVQRNNHLTENETKSPIETNPSKSASNKTTSTKESTRPSNFKKSCLPRVSTLVESLPYMDVCQPAQNLATPIVSLPSMDVCQPVQNLDTPKSSAAAANLKTPATTKRKPKPCPPYKIVEGTTFAVDAFQYGCIQGVTHYFLTHFHADHYIGLTRKFAMPLYMSTITARLVRTFIPIDEQYIHEIELHTPLIVDNVEITALDANHCPGAIMLLFKFPNSGKCILHTGDFRAWHGMESEPDFWNNDIHTIYLDTTYMCHKYAFCTQYESIDKAKDLINKFREKHSHNRILYVCGSYMIGKEKFWSAIAEEYELKVWPEGNRSKALKAVDDRDLNRLLVDDPKNADMHVIPMGKISYLSLVEYFSSFEHEYDKLLAIRPSGWEKDSKPQYRGKINIIGVEYSEHSSYEEMQRFVKFLKPQKVISTVPTGRDLLKTANVPEKWYKYDQLQGSSNYQPCIEQFLAKTPQKKLAIRLPSERMGGLKSVVSPLKKKTPRAIPEINNNFDGDTMVSMKSSEMGIVQSFTTHTSPLAIQENSSNNQEILNGVNNTTDNDVGKQEFIEDNNETLKSISHRVTRQVKNEPKTPEIKTEIILSQSLNDGESCSIFIPTALEFQPVSRANSSCFFESPNIIKKNGRLSKKTNDANSSLYIGPSTSKSKKRRCKCISTSEEEIPVSQKRITRLTTSKQNKAPSFASTMNEDELEFQIQLLESSEKQAPTLKQQGKSASLKVAQTNPILNSTTTSYSTSTTKSASETCMDLKNIPTSIRNTIVSYHEQIPASQTTNDLANTPRPLRNRIKNSLSQIHLSQNEEISASQTTNDLANTPRPLRNKMKLAYLWQTTDEDDVIPASQTSKDLENTPRPLRNKRKRPSVRPKDERSLHNTVKHGRFTVPASCTQTRSLAQILEDNETIDMYDISQSVKIVAEALANQEHDKSVDHIPPELLSSSDLDVDSDEYKDVNPVNHTDVYKVDARSKQQTDKSVDNIPLEFLSSPNPDLDSEDDDYTKCVKQIDVYETSQLVGLVVDALSQQQPDKTVDHIPPELLSPTDQDADDDWLY